METQRLGLPNARRSRLSQSTESDIADVEGELDPKTTHSGPCSRASAVSRSATVSSASSHVIVSQPGSGAPLGWVRRSGCSRRSRWATSSGAALPLTQRAAPVGCVGSGRKEVRTPSDTVAVAPHRETHNGQKVGTSSPAGAVRSRCCAGAVVLIGPSLGPRRRSLSAHRRAVAAALSSLEQHDSLRLRRRDHAPLTAPRVCRVRAKRVARGIRGGRLQPRHRAEVGTPGRGETGTETRSHPPPRSARCSAATR